MPGKVRANIDFHAGHPCPSVPLPFHRTQYTGGSSNVLVNDQPVIRVGDTTSCGDPASQGSPNVFVNSIPVHRIGDSTDGHGCFVPNQADTGSDNVIVN